jgi:4-hydroxy-tetrahydrodipicolinate synthase
MITPFDSQGRLDLDEAKRLARHLQDEGHDGLVVAGTTGEAPTLTDDERLALFAAVIEAVTIPVIAGTGTNDTAHSVHLTREATALGAAGILALCPYYNRPSQAGIEATCGRWPSARRWPRWSTTSRCAPGARSARTCCCACSTEVPNVVALKDAAGNPAETAKVIRDAPAGFEVYSGDDGLTLPLLAVGAVGAVGCRHALDRPRPRGDVRLLGVRRHRRRAAGEPPVAGELQLRDR